MEKKVYITEKQLDEIIRKTTQIRNDALLVRHMPNTGKQYPPEKYGFSSWKEFWEKKTGRAFPSAKNACPCHNNNNDNPDITEYVGSHVKDKNGNMYITPTCASCNTKAINDEGFREKYFSVKEKDLVLFCPEELNKQKQK